MLAVGCGSSAGHSSAPTALSQGADVLAPASATVPTPTTAPAPTNETGAFQASIVLPNAAGVVTLFPDGVAYFSPDGYNRGGGGNTVPAATTGGRAIKQIIAVGTGVDALLDDGSVTYSPNGLNLNGGGLTVTVSSGQSISALVPLPVGVDAILGSGNTVIYSPDGRSFSPGAGATTVYSGAAAVTQIVPVGPANAVVTLFSEGSAYLSPGNVHLGGGGATTLASGLSGARVTRLVPVGGGVLAQTVAGTVYLSPDGANLTGGGATITVGSWVQVGSNGNFGIRDSGHGAVFDGHLWLSGGFRGYLGSNSCYSVCSYFDLWSSVDLTGTTWNATPSFATTTSPNPRDSVATVNNGVQDVAVPTDFYDSYSPLVVWAESLWALGGTVWRSADGTHWTRQNNPDGQPVPGPVPLAGENSRAYAVGSSLFFLQPDAGEVYRTDSADGYPWTDLGPIAGFVPRCSSAMFAMQGKLWIESGGACDYSVMFDDIWSSSDGVTWTKSATTVAFPPRMWPCVAVDSHGVAWMAGGYWPTDWTNTAGLVQRYAANHSDVWYSRDGINWHQYKADAGSGLPDDGFLEPRHAPTCYIGTDASTGGETLVVVAGKGAPQPSNYYANPLNSVRILPLPPYTSLP